MTMLRAFIGWDERDALAFEVCRASLLAHATIPVEVAPLKHWELRRRRLFWRPYWCDETGQKFDLRDGRPFSTGFSFTRFCVPALRNYEPGWVLFCDADMLWRADVAELLALAEDDKAAMVVQHDHLPSEAVKMGGLIQARYQRKNWTSLMLLEPSRCRGLTPHVVNNWFGSDLQAMTWLPDDEIGALPANWNWLEGYSDPAIDPAVVHFTRGTPDMPGTEAAAFAAEWWEYADAARAA